MVGVSRTDEAVVGAVEKVRHLAEPRRHVVHEGLRRRPGLRRRLLDLEPVLVRARHEEHVEAIEALEAGDRVGCDHLIGMADMRRPIRVGDRGRDVIGLAGHAEPW
jgi:DNA-binding GntR family transcriptional regulator